MKMQENLILITFEQEKTIKGIYVPKKQTNNGFVIGTVLKVGPGRLNPYTGIRIPNECGIGDKVLVNIGSCVELQVSDDENKDAHCYVIDGKEVLAIIEEGEDIVV
jgi:co-chaperonin GroES (HSP10)